MVLLMFLSPIAYTPQMVPTEWQWLMQINPLAYLINLYRAVILGGPIDATGLLLFGAVALLTLHIGYRAFMRLRMVLPDYA